MKKIKTSELYFLVLEDYYDYNIRAMSLHISFLSNKSSNNKMKSTSKTKKKFLSIENDLILKKNLEGYRVFFMLITDATNKEIEYFSLLSSMDVSGLSDILYNINSILEHDIDIINNMSSLKNFEADIIDINFYSEKILDNLKNRG